VRRSLRHEGARNKGTDKQEAGDRGAKKAAKGKKKRKEADAISTADEVKPSRDSDVGAKGPARIVAGEDGQ
jgi:hypothetical protein